MNSREQILQTINSNKPTLVELPKINLEELIQYKDLTAQFITAVENIGGTVAFVENELFIQKEIELDKAQNSFIINGLSFDDELKKSLAQSKANDLEKLQKVYLRGSLAVAENGAIWLNENQMLNRLLPFICQHLVIVLDVDAIVATMHHAYQNINVVETGFGAFIAGPSKTADIEQSLVIGAHGAMSLNVLLIKNS